MFVNGMSKSGKIEIRMTLNGKIAERFAWLKDRFGIKNNSELLRLVISLVYRTEKELTYIRPVTKNLKKKEAK